MRKFIEVISQEMEQAFEAAGYDPSLGRVTVSSRPDLCEYQCNGAMAGANICGSGQTGISEPQDPRGVHLGVSQCYERRREVRSRGA